MTSTTNLYTVWNVDPDYDEELLHAIFFSREGAEAYVAKMGRPEVFAIVKWRAFP